MISKSNARKQMLLFTLNNGVERIKRKPGVNLMANIIKKFHNFNNKYIRIIGFRLIVADPNNPDPNNPGLKCPCLLDPH
jgi:hypothetical protein